MTTTDITNREKASYCLGFEAGKGLRMQFEDLDLPLFYEGLQAAFYRETAKIPETEMNQVISAIQQEISTRQREMLERLSDENKAAAEKFLAENKTKPGVMTSSSGLQYRPLKREEAGASPHTLDTVTIHYKAMFLDGTVVETTYSNNQPKTLGINQMIAGWAEALKLMKPGEKWELYVPPYLAYGEAGLAPAIPPNALLIFEVELLSIR
jgi:FKBP-type peptidyl-prolyl cis-trans isomerase FklB